MASIVLLLYGFLFICCLMIIFFTKKRVNLLENNIYSINIIISFYWLHLEILTAFLFFSGYNINSPFYIFITRLIFRILLFMVVFAFYCI